MDSFRPGGYYCYRPFYKGFKVYRNSNDDDNNNNVDNNFNNNNVDNNTNYNNDNNNNVENNLNNNNNTDNTEVQNEARNENLPESGVHSRFVPSEEARRRLYLDLARPRPFYGRSVQNHPERNLNLESNTDFLLQDGVRHSDPKSLQVI